MVCNLFALMCSTGGIIVIVIYYNNFTDGTSKILGATFAIGMVVMFFVLLLSAINVIVSLFKDLESLRKNDYISITGKVLRFKRNIEPESGIQINDRPIVLISDTKEEVELIINDKIVVGETYVFNYLKNCKIAEINKNLH